MIKHCTVGDYSVSQLSGSGIDGVRLNVTRSYMNERLYIERDKAFLTAEDADAYCLARGYIRVWDRNEKVATNHE